MKIYRTINTCRSEPDAVNESNYIHVKAKSDGSETIIISLDDISDPNVIEVSKEEATAILKDWIDAENTPPLPLDIAGNEIVQSYVNLEAYLA
jgi:hypothetical protein